MKAKFETRKASELKKGELVKLKNMYRNIHKITKDKFTVIIETNSGIIYTLKSEEIVKVENI